MVKRPKITIPKNREEIGRFLRAEANGNDTHGFSMNDMDGALSCFLMSACLRMAAAYVETLDNEEDDS